MKKYYTRIETAEMLHISLPTLDKYIRDKIIPAYKVGYRILIDKKELKKTIKNLPKDEKR